MDERYLKPFDVNDPFLWYDLPTVGMTEYGPEPKYINSEDGKITLAQSHFNELQSRIHSLSEKVKEKDDQIEALRMLLTVTDSPKKQSSNSQNTEDESYFNSYSGSFIHNEMLQDQPRMVAFKDVFEKNKEFFKNKTVLDVGCGTGILAMFAATAGAKEVVGIDESEILYQAFDILRENDLHNVVKLIKGKLETQELPLEKFDVIISEWMGYFLLFEGMLDSVIYARETYLAPGGLMLPSKASIHLSGVSDLERHNYMISFWDNVSGFKMSCMKTLSAQEPFVELVKSETIITDVHTVYTLDISTCTSEDMNFSTDFELTINQSSTLTALVGSFDVDFNLPYSVTLSTSPKAPRTHWQQTVFYIKNPISVVAGQKLKCRILCKKRAVNARSFNITITIEGKSQTYLLF
ncbi:protein arginine N-methyltransferase 1 isoform X2 [Cimex lectularius]|nr:protein arginine N-methyltransferase 1 isoform X2 [Cimex lectularius]